MRLLRRLVQIVIVAFIVSWVLATMSDVAASPADGPSPFESSEATTPDTAPGATPPLPALPAPGPAPEPEPAPAPDPWDSWTRDPGGGDHELADPGAVYADGEFQVYGTSSTQCIAGQCRMWWVPRFTSPSLAEPATPAGDAMPERPAWVPESDRPIWAPSVVHVGGRYVLYFAATAASGPHQGLKCLGAAQSPTPAGPFVPEPHPLRCTAGFWNLDPYVVDDGSGPVLVWRQDDAAHPTGLIVAARLRPDGLALADGAEVRTMVAGTAAWEDGYPTGGAMAAVALHDTAPAAERSAAGRGRSAAAAANPAGIGPIENPALARDPTTGTWLLTWSANRWETRDYATGLATCEGPLGPCRRVSTDAPWLRASTDPAISTGARFDGIGGLTFVAGPDDALYALFHAYRAGPPEVPGQRIGWAFRVETADGGYRLVEF
jgi:Glycosyl hydrolases family 43